MTFLHTSTITAVRFVLFSCIITTYSQNTLAASVPIPSFNYKALNTFFHDKNDYTQGLQYVYELDREGKEQGYMYETTGRNGFARLVKYRIGNNRDEICEAKMPDEAFGEGMTVLGDKIYVLTYTEKKLYVYGKDCVKIKEIDYPYEGWGITTDGTDLITTDGSSTVRYFSVNDETITITENPSKAINAKINGIEVGKLNELEMINGKIYANVWKTDMIVIIDPRDNGNIKRWINMAGLPMYTGEIERTNEVLNGIAYDAKENRLFVTGKLWPNLFEICLSNATNPADPELLPAKCPGQ
ncbi:glutaminyl-peptide cyclotransferase [Serratia sp. UGAL515B_01]|uniref:glutaminyl-peptide cyclotransferase n=1 Tax=Serratia sp. UGAL515B_01 TaxID=2986763 RepID=UPI0029532020|nr:glutaminyl-peptide cyclotransferase [Serratia sp. UGAL515B_01]WON75853.1 glutaminyl-peptide cyclotransferase [Serratia sp. UGAL515B_01]